MYHLNLKTMKTIKTMNNMKNSVVAIALFVGIFAFSPIRAQDTETKKIEAVQQEATASFEVNGKCGMCKKRIEKAAAGLEGVQSAEWNVEKKALAVKYDPAKVTETDIQKKVASVGHDTEQVKATDEAYNSLPGCCKYARK
jgi:mercuric ion binding protein